MRNERLLSLVWRGCPVVWFFCAPMSSSVATCQEITTPEIQFCLSVHWGNDHFQGDKSAVLCAVAISHCNWPVWLKTLHTAQLTARLRSLLLWSGRHIISPFPDVTLSSHMSSMRLLCVRTTPSAGNHSHTRLPPPQLSTLYYHCHCPALTSFSKMLSPAEGDLWLHFPAECIPVSFCLAAAPPSNKAHLWYTGCQSMQRWQCLVSDQRDKWPGVCLVGPQALVKPSALYVYSGHTHPWLHHCIKWLVSGLFLIGPLIVYVCNEWLAPPPPQRRI